MTTDNTINEEPIEEPPFCNCEWCDTEIATEDDVQYVNELQLCNDCHDHAVPCGRRRCSTVVDTYSEGLYYIDQTNTSVCSDCADSYYTYCSTHDTYRNNGDHCSYCREDEEEYDYDGGSGVHSYSYKPSPVFHDFMQQRKVLFNRDNGTNPMTGFELEMEYCNADSDDTVTTLTDIFGDFVYFKTDGSLNDGVEMVSHPASINFLRSLEWNRLSEVTRLGVRSSNAPGGTCGLHVHIGKAFFAGQETTFYRFLNMFYSFAEQWKIIGGRDSHYGRFLDPEDANMLHSVKAMRRNGHGSSLGGERYVAVNLQNRHTAELRFFKGTLNPATLMARIESVHAVARFAKDSRFKFNPKSLTWEAFREYTTNEGYEAFNALATKKGI